MIDFAPCKATTSPKHRVYCLMHLAPPAMHHGAMSEHMATHLVLLLLKLLRLCRDALNGLDALGGLVEDAL